jgi:AAA15 family ATPase/GTPase
MPKPQIIKKYVYHMQRSLGTGKQTIPIFVKKLKITNFKSFASFEIEFENINILVGINNSGKSTILQAVLACFYFLRELSRERDSLDIKASRAAVDVSFLNLPDVKDAWHNKRQRGPQRRIIPVIFSVEFTNGLGFEIHLRLFYGQPHIEVMNCTKKTPKSEVDQILQSNPIIVPGFVGVLVNEELKTTQGINRIVSSGRHTEVLRNVLFQLKKADNKRFQLLSSLVDKYFGVRISNVEFNDDVDEFVSALYEDHGVELDIGLGGSGFLQVLQLLTFILIKKSNIVLLDEPDAHLHPSLQKTLIQILTDLSKSENIQFILSTHSKEIIQQTDPRNIIQITNESNVGKRLDSYPELITLMNQLGTLDNVDLALLMKTKRCLFIEGDEQRILKNLATILGKDVFQGNNQVIPISRGGGDNYRYYDDLTIFRKFIGDDLKAYSILDRDMKNEELVEDILKKSEEKHVKTHVWERSEIENYLLVPQLIERIINNKLQQKGDQRQITNVKNLLFDCADEVKNYVCDQYAEKLQHWVRNQGGHMDLSTANTQGREFVEKNWNDWDKRISIAPGKEVIKKLNEKINTQYGVFITPIELSSQIMKDEIPPEISHVLDEIAKM